MQMTSIEQLALSQKSLAGSDRPGPRRPEFRLLLACTTPRLAPDAQCAVDDLLRQSLDWDYLLNLGTWHGMLPLLAHHLTARVNLVPAKISQFLLEYSSFNARGNLRLAAELLNISAALETCGIPHIPYKGVVLGEYLYGEITLRGAGDIDLIVRPEDASKAIACLRQLGFEDAHGLTEAQFAAAMRFGFEHSFTRNGLTVDLHWRVVQNYAWPSFDLEKVWQRLVPFTFYGRELPIFSPELMLAILCIHSAQHDWMHLKMFADISELLSKHPQLDWKIVDTLVADSQARRSMHVALKLSHAYLNAKLPPQLIEEIGRDQRVAEIASAVYSTLWTSAHDPTTTQIDIRWILFRTRGERQLDRFRYVRALALDPSLADFKAFTFWRRFPWLYFLIRPVRIALRRLKTLW
jgi:hypothetical protein